MVSVLRSPHVATMGSDDALEAELQTEGLSLRLVVKEIPPVFAVSLAPQRAARALIAKPPFAGTCGAKRRTACLQQLFQVAEITRPA
jgi:hypothetical protein